MTLPADMNTQTADLDKPLEELESYETLHAKAIKHLRNSETRLVKELFGVGHIYNPLFPLDVPTDQTPLKTTFRMHPQTPWDCFR